MCPNCEVSLTPHRNGAELRCHYCDLRTPAKATCDTCGGRNFFLAGLGTEQVEQALSKRLPDARIVRLDKDTITRKGALEKILSDFSKRKYNVLVGTQIVTKGHDFPEVTLVGVLCADTGMYLPDFRSAERTFQLLSQVSGRAGRGDSPGRVIVQTFNPEHYAITHACNHDYAEFFADETSRRSDPGYPPFVRLALLRAKSKNPTSARSFLLMVANSLRQLLREQNQTDVRILGPSPCAISKIKELFRFQLLIKAPTPSVCNSVANKALRIADQWKHSDVQWRMDIDPQSVL
jgi:primosomal protein N' (replication factor Y)